MYNLTDFTLRDMTECGTALRNISQNSKSMDEVANSMVNYLYDQLIDKQTGKKACTLVRFFKTHSYSELDDARQNAARTILAGQSEPPPNMKCLTLLASNGEKPEWRSRETSVGHKAIPLPSTQVVEQFPMISQLVKQFGLDINTVLAPSQDFLVDLEQSSFNVFHVPQAVGSPYVVAQEEFVVPFGVKSVLGFGGMLPSGNLFTIIIFSKVYIPRETAEMFKTMALNVKVAILPFSGQSIFV